MKYLLKSSIFISIAVFNGLFAVGQASKSYPTSPFPDRIILGWKGETSTSQAVNWRTNLSQENGYAEITEADPSPDFVSKAKTVKAKDIAFQFDSIKAMYHEVNFEGLKPETQYSYRVGAGNFWSEWFHFTTASSQEKPFTFLYFGDAQNDLRSLWSRTIRGAYSNFPKSSFIVHAGDLINRSNADNEWGEWFEAGGWLNGMVPNLATPGNHEYYRNEANKPLVSEYWKPQLALPENGPKGLEETAYFVDYQNTKLISIDSQAALLDSSILQKQAVWLENTLKANKSKWIVVFHHHPIYSTKNGRDNDDWRKTMEPIYKKYQVDLVLQGHDHTYGRGINMPIGKSRDKPDGPIYVVSVSGPKMYDIGLQNWMDRAASNTQLYQAITVNNNQLSFKAYTVTGELYDHFDLIKNAKKVNTLKEYSNTLSLQERLELPERLQKSFKAEQLDEYNRKYQEYKKRKGLK